MNASSALNATNELDRVVVSLPGDASFYSSPHLIGVAIDGSPGNPLASIVGVHEPRLCYKAPYQLMSALCSDRAQRVVDQQLVVAGRPVTPETYLGLWRKALDFAVSPQQLERDYGLCALAVFKGHLGPLMGTKASWTTSPFATFDEFHDQYKASMRTDAEGYFSLELDMRWNCAARDAFYLDSFMSRAFGFDSAGWCSGLVLRGTVSGSAAQQSLLQYESEEA